MGSSLHQFRFPRSSRLKSPRVIRRVFLSGSQLRGNEFAVHWRSNSREFPSAVPVTRLAFVVSKRLGKAHLRNQIKRRLREAVRLNRDHWPVGTDVVLRATDNRISVMEFTALTRDVEGSLRKITARQQ